MKLPPETKARWLHALRHDDYRQAREMLRAYGEDGRPSYCCLGVLVETLEPGRLNNEYDKDFLDECIRGNEEFIVDHGLQALGTSRALPDGVLTDVESILVKMNDSGASFDEIADYIEENL
jgi:hypothetical protein